MGGLFETTCFAKKSRRCSSNVKHRSTRRRGRNTSVRRGSTLRRCWSAPRPIPLAPATSGAGAALPGQATYAELPSCDPPRMPHERGRCAMTSPGGVQRTRWTSKADARVLATCPRCHASTCSRGIRGGPQVPRRMQRSPEWHAGAPASPRPSSHPSAPADADRGRRTLGYARCTARAHAAGEAARGGRGTVLATRPPGMPRAGPDGRTGRAVASARRRSPGGTPATPVTGVARGAPARRGDGDTAPRHGDAVSRPKNCHAMLCRTHACRVSCVRSRSSRRQRVFFWGTPG